MATRTLRPKRDDTMLSDFHSMPESAPSAVRKESTVVAQIFLFVGFFLLLVGLLAMIAPIFGWGYFIRPGWGYLTFTVGACLMLYHCFIDPEPQFRFLYSVLALGLIAGGILLRLFVLTREGADGYFFAIGLPMLLAALVITVGIEKRGRDPAWSPLLRFALLGAGVLMLVYAIIRGHVNLGFLSGEGVVLLLVGLAYLTGFMAINGERDGPLGHRVGLILIIAAAINIAIAVVRSYMNAEFFIPSGLILIAVSILAIAIATLMMSDWPFVVLTKRELAGYFYSPVAYLVLFGALIIFSINFEFYLTGVARRGGAIEPITRMYVVGWMPVIALMGLVPIVTMRTYSEEKRSGSLELLLTAPVNEVTVVLGKFLSSLIFFLFAWTPFFLYMVSMRIFGGSEFDYRPLLSFYLALVATGAGFVAIGGFFSSLTANQMIAALLSFAVILATVMLWLLPQMAPGTITDALAKASFLELWEETSMGYLPLRLFILHAMIAGFFVFLTTLVLSSRRWK